MVYQEGFDENNDINFVLTSTITEEGLTAPLVVKTEIKSNYIKEIEYFDQNYNSLVTMTVNSELQTLEVVNNNTTSKADGCGQAVADCINDNYNNNGWWGVAGYAMTLATPWFGAAVIVGCAAISC